MKITSFLVILTVTLGFMLGATMSSKAQTKSFNGVVPFIAGTDRLGFFDQSTGKVYVYDENFSQCLFTGQLSELGKPILAQSLQAPVAQ